MHFHEMVLYNGQRFPGKPAIVLMDRVITYGMLRQGIMSVAAMLRQKGVGCGASIAVEVDLPSWHLIAALAVAEVGGLCVPVRNAALLDVTGVAVDVLLTTKPPPANRSHGAAAAPRTLVLTEAWFTLPGDRLPDHGYADEDADARVDFSSGTTGQPKPILRSNRDIDIRQIQTILNESHLGWTRMLLMIGIESGLGFNRALYCLRLGGTLILPQTVEEAARMLTLFAADYIVASVTETAGLMTALGTSPAPLPALRGLWVTGGLMTAAFVRRVRSAFPCEIIFSYGSTEAGGIAHASSLWVEETDGVAGFVLPWAAVEILDEAGNPVPSGTEGRIRCRGIRNAKAYGKASDAAGFDAQGWHFPGDTGYIRADGLLIITGRTDHLINAGGEKIAPEILEDALRMAPQVNDAGVVAITRSDGQTEVWAAVVSPAPVDPMQLIGWSRMRGLKVPIARVIQVAALPRNANGKIIRKDLRQLVEAGAA